MSPERMRLLVLFGLIAAGIAFVVAAVVVYTWYTLEGVDIVDLVFFFVAAVVVGCGLYAILAKNIVRSVFSLLGTFFGMAGLYAMLSADFLAIVQLMVYVGGILVLMLFAVMLTSRIEEAHCSNRSAGLLGLLGAGLIALVLFGILATVAVMAPWPQQEPGAFQSTVHGLGKLLLSDALLPFEMLSVVLLGIAVGAVVLARLPFGYAKKTNAEEAEGGAK